MFDKDKPDSWESYARSVIEGMKRLEDDHKDMRGEVVKLRLDMVKQMGCISKEVALLKAKAAIWGSLGGSAFSAVISYIMTHLKP